MGIGVIMSTKIIMMVIIMNTKLITVTITIAGIHPKSTPITNQV